MEEGLENFSKSDKRGRSYNGHIATGQNTSITLRL